MTTKPHEPLARMSSGQTSKSTYTQGHSASVVASHTSRTVENSASFLLPHLKPHYKIVDLGCGPGTITRGFCSFVPQGSVTGIDSADSVIEQARSQAPQTEYPNLNFRVGDITQRLPCDDNSVDVVYTHMTLLHVPSPVQVVEEARRVLKPGGMLAMREADHAEWEPSTPALDKYNNLLFEAARSTGAQGAGAGRRLHVWALQAGFERSKMSIGGGATVYTAPDESKWWADVHVGRLEGEVGKMWLENKLVDSQKDVDDMKAALRTWKESDNAWYGGLQGEVICWK
ncbi:ubiE/COQ5 methyltransferase [Exophiala viscosa]|uniref:ubiE/COQ5 methyltransferase n=1 Tax=Exophiala viscosa TaxID=2486360 RepID=UPI0021914873|nr:ubiE/COQ5 methyltransferase [Exophiala viscosa]